jgi:hypothetical protein
MERLASRTCIVAAALLLGACSSILGIQDITRPGDGGEDASTDVTTDSGTDGTTPGDSGAPDVVAPSDGPASSDGSTFDASGDCVISGTVYTPGAANPANACETCEPSMSRIAWTLSANGSGCGPADAGSVCNSNTCVVGCYFAGAFQAPTTANPNDPCQTCQPATSTTGWSNLPDGTGCGNGQVCGGGQCGSQCDIGGTIVASGASNPGDACQSCQPGTSTSAWTEDSIGSSCGTGMVCSGTACISGCFITPTAYDAGAPNTADPCQSCVPASSTTGWTSAVDGTTCGSPGDVCTGGNCAAGCYIDQTFYPQGTVDPANACSTCVSTTSTGGWTPAAGGSACGNGGTCTSGSCMCGATDAGALTLCSPDGGDQYCANTASDPNNCSACGAACTGSMTSCCASACTSLQTDSHNCGTCGHDCLGGVCASGVCQPLVLAGSQNNPQALYVDSSNVYWTATNAGTVMKCAIGGCGLTPTTIASGQNGPEGIIVDANNVYWVNYDGGSVARCAIGGCAGTPTTLATGLGSPTSVAVDATYVYWTSTGGTVERCAIAGCGGAPTTIASGLSEPTALAVDGTSVYWVTYSGGSVQLCPKAGCGGNPPTLLAGAQNGMVSIDVDSTTVYWSGNVTVGSVGLFSCPIAGCGGTPTTLLSGLYAAPTWIALDPVSPVVWFANAGSGIASCPETGCGTTPAALDSNADHPQSVFADAKRVYWIQNSDQEIFQLAK